MKQLVFRLPEPPSANRWWRNVNGRMVTSKAAGDYKATVYAECLKQLGVGWNRGCILAPMPVGVRIEWHRKRKAGDLDKRLGVMLDALQGIAYENDSQIVDLKARRFDETSPIFAGTVFVWITPDPLLIDWATAGSPASMPAASRSTGSEK